MSTWGSIRMVPTREALRVPRLRRALCARARAPGCPQAPGKGPWELLFSSKNRISSQTPASHRSPPRRRCSRKPVPITVPRPQQPPPPPQPLPVTVPAPCSPLPATHAPLYGAPLTLCRGNGVTGRPGSPGTENSGRQWSGHRAAPLLVVPVAPSRCHVIHKSSVSPSCSRAPGGLPRSWGCPDRLGSP